MHNSYDVIQINKYVILSMLQNFNSENILSFKALKNMPNLISQNIEDQYDFDYEISLS